MRIVLIMAALLLGSGCESRPKAASGVPVVGWRQVESWSGHGDTQTDSFNIESGQWRIRWTTRNEKPSGSGTFQVTVHSAVSGRPLFQAVDVRGTGSGTAWVNEDPRLFHLVIESRNVDWSISVQESVIGNPQTAR